MDITVDLVSTGNPDPAWQVTFPDGGDVAVATGVETITWVIGSAPPRAAITAVTLPSVPEDPPWNGDLPTAANDWTATDDNDLPAGSAAVSWEYTVTITYQGVPYVSDPKITNQPPTVFIRLPASTHVSPRLPNVNRLPYANE